MSNGFDSWHDIGSLFVIIVGGVFLIIVPIFVYGLGKIDKKFTGGQQSRGSLGFFVTLLTFVGILALCFYISEFFL